MGVFTRYWLAQLPGWGISAAVLAGAWKWFGMPLWLAIVLFSLVVVKDVVLYPFMRRALESPPHIGPGSLVGSRGVVIETLEPEGRVRVGGELWRAVARGAAVGTGSGVRVEAVRGLTLIVTADE